MRAPYLLDSTESSGEASLFWYEDQYVGCPLLDKGVGVDVLESFFRAEVECLPEGSLFSLTVALKSLS